MLPGQEALALKGGELTLQGEDLNPSITKRKTSTTTRGCLSESRRGIPSATRRSSSSATRRSNPSATRRENSSCLVSIYLSVFSFSISCFVYVGKMTINTKLDERLEGADNLRAWKYGIMLTLEESQSGRVH